MVHSTQCSDNLMKPLFKYMDFINHISRYRGIKFAVKYNKLVRLSFTRYLARDVSPLAGIKLRLDGLAYCIYHLKPWIHNSDDSHNREDIQVIMTMLSCPRALRLQAEPDFSSITSPGLSFSGDQYLRSFRGFVKSLKKLSPNNFVKKGLYLKNPYFVDYHLSTKTGPSSFQSTYSCLLDLDNLPNHLVNSIREIGGDRFCKQFDRIYQ